MQVFCHFSDLSAENPGTQPRQGMAAVRSPRYGEPKAPSLARGTSRLASQNSTRRAGSDHRNGVHKSPLVAAVLGWLSLLAGVFHPTPAQAIEITEPGSGQRFVSPFVSANKQYTLVGTGLRKRDNGAAYAMALYVEDTARQSFPAAYDRANRTRAGLFSQNRAHNFFIWGHFAKLAVLRMLRGHSRQELMQGFSEPLAELLTEKSAPELRQDTLTFLGLFDTDLREGQELRLHTDDHGQIDVYLDGKKKAGPANPRLVRHLWEIWLGFHPVQPQMRQSLLDRLDVLAQLPTSQKPPSQKPTPPKPTPAPPGAPQPAAAPTAAPATGAKPGSTTAGKNGKPAAFPTLRDK